MMFIVKVKKYDPIRNIIRIYLCFWFVSLTLTTILSDVFNTYQIYKMRHAKVAFTKSAAKFNLVGNPRKDQLKSRKNCGTHHCLQHLPIMLWNCRQEHQGKDGQGIPLRVRWTNCRGPMLSFKEK